jgi:hypothetical protein
MEVNFDEIYRLDIYSERGKECRDMIMILDALGYGEAEIKKVATAYFSQLLPLGQLENKD